MKIVTQRLLLRDFTDGDLPAFLDYHADPRYAEFYGPGEIQPHYARELFRTFKRWAAERPRRNYQLAIAQLDEPRQLVGCCGVRGNRGGFGRAEFGIELDPRWWHHGYATEAAHALLRFGFCEMGLEQVRGLSVTANARAASLVRQLGFIIVCERPGLAWMRRRGWSQTEWQLTRRAWEVTAAV